MPNFAAKHLSGLVLFVAVAALSGISNSGAASAPGVSVVPVVFHVQNTNHSSVPCPSDNQAYDVAGHLVAPAGGATPGVALYLHGLGHGEWLWNFGAVPGSNHAVEMARLGHTSVVVDRIGYDHSDHPEGTRSCVGAQADVASQVVQALRTGEYDATGATPPAFSKVALVGLSAGGMIAEIEAYSFGGIDALGVLSYADQGASQATFQGLFQSGGVCLRGGEHAESGPDGGDTGTPSGYAYFGQTDNDFVTLMFHDADPAVVAAATKLRNRDPCGDLGSLATGTFTDQARIGGITVPVFVGCGRKDAVFPPPACDDQVGHYRASASVTSLFLDGTGHMLPLERTADSFRRGLATWLGQQGA